MVRRLIEVGHSVNYPTLGDLHPMHDAIIIDNSEILSLIVNNSEFNVGLENDFWRAPLYQSLFINNKLHIAKVLLESCKFALYFEGHSLLEILLEMAPYVPSKKNAAKLIISAGCDCLHLGPHRSVYQAWLDNGMMIGGVEDRITIITILMAAGMYPALRECKALDALCATEEEEIFCKWLRVKCSQVCDLQQLCKLCIRNSLGIYCKQNINYLPLPKLLQGYLAEVVC